MPSKLVIEISLLDEDVADEIECLADGDQDHEAYGDYVAGAVKFYLTEAEAGVDFKGYRVVVRDEDGKELYTS